MFAALILVCTIAALVFGENTPDFDCTAPRDSGNECNTASPKLHFYYDKNSGVCQPFMYAGCGGSANRFETALDCRQKCVEQGGATKKPGNITKQKCNAPYLFDGAKSCQSAKDCEDGFECSNNLCCPNRDRVCAGNYDSGRLAEGVPKADRYFFSPQYRVCMRFTYYGTVGNANNFADYNSCMGFCSAGKS